MAVIHFYYASDGGAGRAAQRASHACNAAGLASSFAFVAGKPTQPGDVQVRAETASGMHAGSDFGAFLRDWLQWEYIPEHRTSVSNTLFSTAYPGVDLHTNRAFETAEIVHLHWPTWGMTPRALSELLATGRTVFWTLHDFWPMTGGCHYPAGCEQYRTICMKCPQLESDSNLVTNSFLDKQRAYGGEGNLWIVAPSRWMADIARSSALFRHRQIHVVPNPVELDVFAPRRNRRALRAAFGVGPDDLVLLFASFDLAERRKGVGLLFEAVRQLAAEGTFRRLLSKGAAVHMAVIGESAPVDEILGIRPLTLGTIDDDRVLADVYSISDVVGVPSLEDNYPNVIVEAMACGTPCLGTATGGIPEMIEDGRTGILVEPAGSIEALRHGLVRFIESHFRSATMRRHCRTAAETRNEPAGIGMQLRGLYQEALGRPLGRTADDLRPRVLAALARVPARMDALPGGEFLQFPFNKIAGENFADSSIRTNTEVSAVENRVRLITVRAYHEHHSAYSGPYQFVRHLPRESYSARHVTVPLGAKLSSKFTSLYEKAGALMGVPGFGQQANAWLAEAELLLSCASEDIDIVHFIDGELAGCLLPHVPGDFFYRKRRPVLIATYHQPPRILEGLITADILNAYTALIVLCESQRELVSRHVNPSSVFVIPHGIDTEFFHPPPEPRMRGRGDIIRLLLVGHWLRDLTVAMAAYKALHASGIEFRLTIVSPSFARQIDDPAVRILSNLSDEALRHEYWDADLLFLPLVDATANNAILEAMACGLPVMSTDVGGVAEAVDTESGVLCVAGDAEAFAIETLRLARSSPRRLREMSQAARSRAEQFSWRVSARQHAQVYEKVLSQHLLSKG